MLDLLALQFSTQTHGQLFGDLLQITRDDCCPHLPRCQRDQ